MAHVRVRSAGQETWYRNVTAVWQDRYLGIALDAYPHQVFFWREGGQVSVLVCQTDEDVTTALREEHAATYQAGVPWLSWDETVEGWLGR